jgi:hypothetical protein
MSMAVDPTDPSRIILANADSGISSDGLQTYVTPGEPAHVDHLRVAFAPSDPSIVYGANDGGIWRSEDRGETWYRFDSGINTNLSFGFDIDPASGTSFLSSGDYNFSFDSSATSESISHVGDEWSKFYIDPSDATTVWYASVNSDLTFSREPRPRAAPTGQRSGLVPLKKGRSSTSLIGFSHPETAGQPGRIWGLDPAAVPTTRFET